MKQFSDNIVFLDTEFTDLDPYKGEILSIGIIKPTGEELYIELEYEGEVHPWVEENILPTLTHKKLSREEAIKRIKAFIGSSQPFMVAFVPQFDMVYLTKLFGVGNLPFHWMSIDFASMLFADNIDPKEMLSDFNEDFLKKLNINKKDFQSHHALDDARLLKQVYEKLIQ